MTAHNKASHAVNRQFEEELDALVKRYLEAKDICSICVADVLQFYAEEIEAANFERTIDIAIAGLLRSSGRLT